jgi:hypothetical protein
MSTQAFQLDPSLANMPLEFLRKRYEEMTPEERRIAGFVRQATQGEFDQAQPSQGGAPADFAGRVLQNAGNVQVSDDTDSGIPALRLPNGVSATTGAYTGTPKLDVSNPAQAQVLPAAMQTVGSEWAPVKEEASGDASAWKPVAEAKGEDVHAPEQKGILRQAWDWANKGLISGDTLLNIAGETSPSKPKDMKPGETTVEYLKRVRDQIDPNHPWIQGIKSGLAGANLDAYNMAGGFTSPLSLATLLAGPAEKAPGAAGKAARALSGVASAGFAAKGTSDVVDAATDSSKDLPTRVQEGLQGAAMAAGGVAGAAESAKPTIKAVSETAPKVLEKVRNVTPKQAAQVVGGGTGAVAGHGTLSAPGAYYGAKTAGKITEGVLGKERANAPIFKKPVNAAATRAAEIESPTPKPESKLAPVERDATLNKRNIPEYAGEEEPAANSMVSRSKETPQRADLQQGEVAEPQSPRDALRDSLDRLGSGKPKLRSSYKTISNGIIYEYKGGQFLKDGTVLDSSADIADAVDALEAPPGKVIEGQTVGTKEGAARDTKLYQQAKKELGSDASVSEVAKRAQELKTSPYTGTESRVVPATHNIRENLALVKEAEAAPSRINNSMAERLQDKALSQEMNWDLEKHGYKADSEARREFIARNSTGTTKGDLIKQANQARANAPIKVTEDLTPALKKSVDYANAKKGGVMTTADPGMLAERWGASEKSIADTDAQLRGKTAGESQKYIDQLAESYKKGHPVQPVMETRDAANNLIEVDGRHRALAAKKAGITRIPVIVRRIGVASR